MTLDNQPNKPQEEIKEVLEKEDTAYKEKTIKEDPKIIEDSIPKYEIKLVEKYRFPSNISIKAIDNLSILKNWAVNNMKNVFVIKNNYKTYVFTLTDDSSTSLYKAGSNENMKSSVLTPQADSDKNANRNTVYLKVYGISQPEENFLKGIINTIQAQIDQLALIERAKSIFKFMPSICPSISDYDFIRETSDKIFIYYKLPSFVINFMKYITLLKEDLAMYMTQIQMGSTQKVDRVISGGVHGKSATMLKKSFKNSPTRNSFYVNQQMFSSMAGEPSEDLIDPYQSRENVAKSRIEEEDEDRRSSTIEVNQSKRKLSKSKFSIVIEQPQTLEDCIKRFRDVFDPDDYTFLYNGFASNINALDRKTKSLISKEQIFMSTFGASLATVTFGISLNSSLDFSNKLKSHNFEKLLSIHCVDTKQNEENKNSVKNQ
jgi:hypothetical protein